MNRNERKILAWFDSQPRPSWHDAAEVAAAVNMPRSIARRALNGLVDAEYLKTGISTTGIFLYMRQHVYKVERV